VNPLCCAEGTEDFSFQRGKWAARSKIGINTAWEIRTKSHQRCPPGARPSHMLYLRSSCLRSGTKHAVGEKSSSGRSKQFKTFNCQNRRKFSLVLTDSGKPGGGPCSKVARSTPGILRERRPRYTIFPQALLEISREALLFFSPRFSRGGKGTWAADHALYSVRGVWSCSDFFSLSSSHPVSMVRKVLIDIRGRLQAIMHQRQSRE